MTDSDTRPEDMRTGEAAPRAPMRLEPSQKHTGLARPGIIAIVGAIVVAGALILNYSLQTPLVGGRSKTATTAPASGPTLPAFDVVRVDAKGNTVMAGRALPNARIVILDGDTELGEVAADARGEWVFTPDAPLAPGTRQLSLRMTAPGGKTQVSDRVVVMSVPEHGGEVLIVEQGRDGGKSRVLQGTGAAPGLTTLNVETADYDSTGKISLSGKAEPGATVQVYFDNEFIGRAAVDDKGYWQVEAPGKAVAGNHTVRVDQVGQSNSVLSRVEVPFPVEAGRVDGNPGEVTVVKGNSLWRIARRVYGQGMMYTVIFDANQEHIKNPDLIYPGQVFTLPVKDRI